VALAALSGCASTATIREATSFSDAGIQYTNSVSELVDYVRDATVDADSEVLLAQLDLVSGTPGSKDRLTGYLTNHDDALVKVVEGLSHLKAQLRLLRNYFVNLQSLAKFDAAGGTEEALAGLSGQINGLNSALKKDGSLLLSADQQTAIAKLGGLAARSALAARIRAALERDAPVIGEQLMLQRQALDELGVMLTASFEQQMRAVYRSNVQWPYADAKISDANRWKQARRRRLTDAFLSEQLAAAASAAENMQAIWKAQLSGNQDPRALQGMLADIGSFLGAIEALKQSVEAK
jgi:hypothetical protein